MHTVWKKKYLKYKNKYNNLIGGGRILINIYTDKQVLEHDMMLMNSTNIKELLSNMKYRFEVQKVIDYPQSYEYKYEINSTKIPIETIKTNFISKIK